MNSPAHNRISGVVPHAMQALARPSSRRSNPKSTVSAKKRKPHASKTATAGTIHGLESASGFRLPAQNAAANTRNVTSEFMGQMFAAASVADGKMLAENVTACRPAHCSAIPAMASSTAPALLVL